MNIKAALNNVGWNGKFLAHVMPWVGEPNHIHRNASYCSNNAYTISSQLSIMQQHGIDGVILTWRGVQVAAGWDQAVAQKIAAACASRGMLFAYLLDPGILKYRADASNPIETTLINNFNDPSVQAVLNGGSYLPEGFVLDFLTGYSVNWAAVAAGTQGATKLSALKRHSGYAWPGLDSSAGVAKDHANQAMKIPAVAFGFCDSGCPLPYGCTPATYSGSRDYSQSVWSTAANSQPARVNDPRGGNYYLDCVQSIGASQYAKAAPYCAVVTWNDYDEGTAVEQVFAALSGVRMNNVGVL